MNIYHKAQSWCIKNNITVYIVPIKDKKECFIEVNDNDNITRSPNFYKNQSIASEKIWDLILYLYKQNSNYD